MTVVGTLDELIQKLDTQRQIGNRLVPAVHEFEIVILKRQIGMM